MKLSECPLCGSADIRRTRGPFTAQTRGRTIKIPKVPQQRCQNCGEVYFDRESNVVLDRFRGRSRRQKQVM